MPVNAKIFMPHDELVIPRYRPKEGIVESTQNNGNGEEDSPSTVNQIKDLEELQKFISDAELKSTVINFGATSGCAGCKMIKPYWNELSGSFNDRVNFIYCDIDGPDGRAAGLYYNITAMPTFVFLKRDFEVPGTRVQGSNKLKLLQGVNLLAGKRRNSGGLGSADLKKSLATHFSKFGTVKSVDGLGQLDGVGQPRKFGYISIEGAEASITKCVNSLSGSIWKGVKVRVGDAKPDYSQRVAAENAPTTDAPPNRKRKHGAVFAEDMTLVTPENAVRRGWKVTEMGRMLRPMKMRPLHPLPPPLSVEPQSKKAKQSNVKPKRRRDPDSRARRRTIDVTRWGSVHLKGLFLENAGQLPKPEYSHPKPSLVEESDTSSSEEDLPTPPILKPAVEAAHRIQNPRQMKTIQKRTPAPPVPLAVKSAHPTTIDLLAEKSDTLNILNSLFGRDAEQWGGRESVGSDVDEEELLKIGGIHSGKDTEDDIEFVPMNVDNGGLTQQHEADEVPQAAAPREPSRATKLKELFAPRTEDGPAGFSLLGHLDLDLDETQFADLTTTKAPTPRESQPTLVFVPANIAAHAPITLDPKQPLFFPLPSSFSDDTNLKARQRDIIDVAKDAGWSAHFCKTETDEEIRTKWEAEKIELTRDWTRRWKEAGKMQRRRRGGAPGED
ncbi:hypothetical protein MIND_00381600 [Mycena indigotica]|uniref:Thioredoxin domain-containing protein n=1 Tax=Mycena indigotica TaxID=2126181 RepID=A0A8H6WCT6_9AGAR|nr:uncharacterized protein MIND_00381600 [Mycena indigotica]KAF7310083.1 hypothetical protein MIND_00381600 [Mycena indigotica]